MKKLSTILFACSVILFLLFSVCPAADQRAVMIEAEEIKASLLQRAREEAGKAAQENKEVVKRIYADRNALKATISDMKLENRQIKTHIDELQQQLTVAQEKEKELKDKLAVQQSDVRELVGVIRANVRDLETQIAFSPQSALVPDRTGGFHSLVNQTAFPEMEDIERMCAVLFDEINRSGEVRIESAPFITRDGGEAQGKVLVLGNFTAAYQHGDETGLLIYSDTSQRFFALSKLPPRRMVSAINRYMAGKSEAVPIDVSRGAALRQLTYRMSFWERIQKGGPIVWPILVIGLVGILIIFERVIYLLRKRVRSAILMKDICDHAGKKNWEACRNICRPLKGKPLGKVLLAGIQSRDMNREDIENALQETILSEIPKMERFLSTLGMLAAISPLLGLLGTVTGMINTFHIITLYGTGDPRLMSGGISEALVTTMLGLTVAIPLMLAHTLIAKQVENNISEMEEKAVAFVNTVFATRRAT